MTKPPKNKARIDDVTSEKMSSSQAERWLYVLDEMHRSLLAGAVDFTTDVRWDISARCANVIRALGVPPVREMLQGAAQVQDAYGALLMASVDVRGISEISDAARSEFQALVTALGLALQSIPRDPDGQPLAITDAPPDLASGVYEAVVCLARDVVRIRSFSIVERAKIDAAMTALAGALMAVPVTPAPAGGDDD